MRRRISLQHPKADPRYGIAPGDDEADNYNRIYYHKDVVLHFYATPAEMYRAFAEIGKVWQEVGKIAGRADVVAHGAELLKDAPLIYTDLHASFAKTVNTTVSPGDRCYPHRVEGNGSVTVVATFIPQCVHHSRKVITGLSFSFHMLTRAQKLNRYDAPMCADLKRPDKWVQRTDHTQKCSTLVRSPSASWTTCTRAGQARPAARSDVG